MNSKWFLRSKTFWANGLMAGGMMALSGQVDSAEVFQMAGLGIPAGNVLLRLVTKEALGRAGKRILQSKTVWANLAVLGGAGLAFNAGQPELGATLGGLGGLNLVLRGVTRSGITLAPHPYRSR